MSAGVVVREVLDCGVTVLVGGFVEMQNYLALFLAAQPAVGPGKVGSESSKYRELRETFFFTPITGFISDHYDVKKGHYGVDIVAKTNEPVKCIADGTVILASWTQDAGYVIAIQHRGNLISVFKHNAELLKKVGSFVNAGEIISIVGNSGEMTDGPHLHFELWYNGNSLNPEEFVTF